ncbi:hypothetical protein BDN72DRAFT_831457 [Pluteus cervinus]|uniref:Uncharacterized protein n=1 Tax=Pluteus cervinus TaxID=181527 RepID=A0ACD3BDC6_9AGAR|nr:hypothetical protein BDN72DRAFT_831457 [Pluteus cervinus]
MATAASSTLLAIVGMQMGHVQLIHLPECVPPAPRGPPFPDPPLKRSSHVAHTALMIAAHKSALATLSIPPSGGLLATTSSQGTLVRVWDTSDGKILGEFRRGLDKAEIYGVAFRPDEREICVWSDKGTIHAFTLGWSGATNRQSKMFSLTPYIPLPDYFNSAWSYAKYRIPVQSAHISLSSTTSRGAKVDAPEEERCVVGWVKVPTEGSESRGPVEEYQMIALTYAGGWYRLSLPKSSIPNPSTPPPKIHQLPHSPTKSSSAARPRTESGSSTIHRTEKGKEKEEKVAKESQNCTLQEFRRFGRWDGWG